MPILTIIYQATLVSVAAVVGWLMLADWRSPEWRNDDSDDLLD